MNIKDFFEKIKTLVITILALNGLGLIVYGKKNKNLLWMIFGSAYILAEIIFVFLNLRKVCILVVLAAIIHTLVICYKHSELFQTAGASGNTMARIINQKRDHEPNNYEVHSYTMKKNDTDSVNSVVNSYDHIENKENINIRDLRIGLGSATIFGETRDKLDIQITDNTGRIYSFKSDGNNIVSFKVGASESKYYI